MSCSNNRKMRRENNRKIAKTLNKIETTAKEVKDKYGITKMFMSIDINNLNKTKVLDYNKYRSLEGALGNDNVLRIGDTKYYNQLILLVEFTSDGHIEINDGQSIYKK